MSLVAAALFLAVSPASLAVEPGLQAPFQLRSGEYRIPEPVATPEWVTRLANSRGVPDCDLVGNPNTFDYVVRLTTWPGLVPDRIVYIDASAPFGGDGSSWTNAYQSLHDALNAESFSTELVDIRIATGFYRADRVGGMDTLDPELTFQLPGITVTDGVPTGVMRVAGGFAGRNARNPDARDLDLYPTVFTGDLFGNDTESYENYEDNTKVMFEPGLTELNGITIEHARVAVNELRWMTDCTVRWCFASGDDLPLVRDDRSPVLAREARIVGNTFHNNRAEAYGGALAPRGLIVVANSRFLRNTAMAGGAIGVRFGAAGQIIAQNCYFAANSADGAFGGVGGAIYNSNSGSRSTRIVHCTFVGNWAQDGGGHGAVGGNASANIQNSIFDQNYSYAGTGFDSEIMLGAHSSYADTVRASVFARYNENAVSPPQPFRFRLNIGADPAFRNLLGEDGVLGTLDDDPSLSTQSPAIGRS
ncbi:MAG: right-handed parallel beta-helix repeat-containing protein, partial [Phycisphaerales bacterium]